MFIETCTFALLLTNTSIHIVQVYITLDTVTVAVSVASSTPKHTESSQWCLTHFRLDYHHLNGLYAFYIIFVERVLYFESIEYYSHSKRLRNSLFLKPAFAKLIEAIYRTTTTKWNLITTVDTHRHNKRYGYRNHVWIFSVLHFSHMNSNLLIFSYRSILFH